MSSFVLIYESEREFDSTESRACTRGGGRSDARTHRGTGAPAARPSAGDGTVGNSLLLAHLASVAMQAGTAAYLDHWPAKANRWFG